MIGIGEVGFKKTWTMFPTTPHTKNSASATQLPKCCEIKVPKIQRKTMLYSRCSGPPCKNSAVTVVNNRPTTSKLQSPWDRKFQARLISWGTAP